MKLATWNVNSIRSRLGRLEAWLRRHRPDVLCLQELKCTDEQFPYEALAGVGYQSAVFGQKAYNGVAILARQELRDVRRGFGDGSPDTEARLISAEIEGVRVFSAYVPNGQVVGSEKFTYKLAWLARLADLLRRDFDPAAPIVLAGDFNVAVSDRDVYDPNAWAESVLCVPEVRGALELVRQWGFVDVFARFHPEGGVYSWWDYRRLAFPRNQGLRLDHVYATAAFTERCTSAYVDRDERKGEKPSDHAPVVVEWT
ncbi:MAG: exodeoxyribonuclease III [Phycisphaerae bacterium]|nr:exodeoxyribonuclease III [Phycisphaerae bacterium]